MFPGDVVKLENLRKDFNNQEMKNILNTTRILSFDELLNQKLKYKNQEHK